MHRDSLYADTSNWWTLETHFHHVPELMAALLALYDYMHRNSLDADALMVKTWQTLALCTWAHCGPTYTTCMSSSRLSLRWYINGRNLYRHFHYMHEPHDADQLMVDTWQTLPLCAWAHCGLLLVHTDHLGRKYYGIFVLDVLVHSAHRQVCVCVYVCVVELCVCVCGDLCTGCSCSFCLKTGMCRYVVELYVCMYVCCRIVCMYVCCRIVCMYVCCRIICMYVCML